ncbi:WD40/YVTN/BNR-like repeat-containing protein [Cohnella abietis]|uniref:Photosynthesis system II assembly factor Ycf48/Hcf136-like domain-containing protein n=1 Tax=Cohnella abietis TaxID=2507935 RepID=A0A3T1D0L0_9BACL|nr:hypothetical protein [Cohnella abietis]BBI31647.1 hypothetical protein KCTCHS21_10460 [Cohnella abietis]
MSSLKTSTFLLTTALLVTLIAGCGKGSNTSIPTTSAEASHSAVSSPSQAPATSSNLESIGNTGGIPSSSPTVSSNQDTLGEVTAIRLASFKSGWAGGKGWIARTDDGGKTWKTQLKHKYIVTQLFALNDKTAWATLDINKSQGLQLLHTTNGGSKWTEAGIVPNRAFLHFISSKEAFSGNAYTSDGGKTWVKLPVPASLVGDSYFHDRNHGWAVTQEEGKDKFNITRTTDGGKTWRSVLSRANTATVTGVVIRSTGKADAWVELIGDSGMSQTSYSLFHTIDGGKSWIPVLANNQAGSGPAPGYEMNKETNVPHNTGSSPGALYVVNPSTAFMGGQCSACDLPNTLGKTTDGGKTWISLKAAFPGYGAQQIAAVDANHIWWVNTENSVASIMYTSFDGGKSWSKVHTFKSTKTQ